MAAPQPTRRDFAILGQPDRAPLAQCIQSHERLAAKFDPRHRPPDEQPTWIAVQDRLDAALALIVDCARFAAEEGRVAA